MVIRCGSLGTIAGFRFGYLRRGSVVLGRANGQYIWIVAGSGDGAEPIASLEAQTTEVAPGHYHHNACLPSRFYGLAEGILRVADADSAPQRQIDDPNVVGVL